MPPIGRGPFLRVCVCACAPHVTSSPGLKTPQSRGMGGLGCGHVEAGGQPWVSSLGMHSTSFETRSLTGLKPNIWARQIARDPPVSAS